MSENKEPTAVEAEESVQPENSLTEAEEPIQPDAPAVEAVPLSEDKPKPTRRGKKKQEAEAALKNFDSRTGEPPKKRKFGWVGTVLLLVVIGLSIWMMLEIVTGSGDEIQSLGEILAGSSWQFALITLAVLVAVMLFDCLKYAVVLKTTTGRFHIRESVKVAFLGKFYDNITPFAAGGQPMQIYYLHKKGFSGGVSSAVVLIKYFAQMFSWVTVSLVFMASCSGVLDLLDNSAQKTLLMVAGSIGLCVNMLLPVTVILFALLPKFARAVCAVVVGAGAKIKIVKDKEKATAKAEAFVNDFRSAFKIMSHRPLNLIFLMLFCVAEVFLTFSVPYFAMKTFAGLGANDGIYVMIEVMAINIFVTQSVAVVPTPGNTGAMEGLGALAFSVFVTGSVQFWSMFGWRFAVYYIYVLVGLGITVFEFIRNLVRMRRKKRKEKEQTSDENS